MSHPNEKPTVKTAFNLSLIGAFIAGLCCFSPLILFLAGLTTASFAGSLADSLYYQYKWYFRLAGITFLVITFVVWYKKRSQSCSLDETARLRKKMINLFLLSLITLILAYSIWLYIVVELLGIKLGLWDLPKSVNIKTFI